MLKCVNIMEIEVLLQYSIPEPRSEQNLISLNPKAISPTSDSSQLYKIDVNVHTVFKAPR